MIQAGSSVYINFSQHFILTCCITDDRLKTMISKHLTRCNETLYSVRFDDGDTENCATPNTAGTTQRSLEPTPGERIQINIS